MPGPWNDTTDRLLLLSIIHLTAPQLPKWDEVAKMMGPGFTAASTRQHFQKLRKESRDSWTTPSDVASKGTPRKGKGVDINGVGAKKRKGDGDEDDEENPAKKMMMKEIKVEEGEEDQVTPTPMMETPSMETPTETPQPETAQMEEVGVAF